MGMDIDGKKPVSETGTSKDLEIAPAKKLCDVFNNEYFTKIKAMTWKEFSADLVRRQRDEWLARHPGEAPPWD